MRIASWSHAIFALMLIGVGCVGLRNRDLMPLWNPVPSSGVAHDLLACLCIGVSLLSGVGLLVYRTAAAASRVLLAILMIWMLAFRLPALIRLPLFEACWLVFPLAVMLAAAIVLYRWFALERDRRYFASLSSRGAIRIAHVLFGLSLIFFGLAHFIDLKDTLALVPAWLPVHAFWAYATGCAYIGAGVATISGVFGRLAAALATLQIGLFLLLVWIPIVGAGSKNTFEWSECFLNVALLAGAWVCLDSYKEPPPPTRGLTTR